MGNLFGQPTGLSREVCLFAGADWLQLIITSEGGERPIVFCVLVKWNEPVCVKPPPPGGGCAVGTFCIVTDVVAVVSRPHFKGTIFLIILILLLSLFQNVYTTQTYQHVHRAELNVAEATFRRGEYSRLLSFVCLFHNYVHFVEIWFLPNMIKSTRTFSQKISWSHNKSSKTNFIKTKN